MQSLPNRESSTQVNNGVPSGGETIARLECHTCRRQFSRPEHLRRHSQVHAQSKPFKCCYCDKTFARKDAAQRHQNIHGSVSDHTQVSESSSLQIRRTCSACASSRIECSGDVPCTRCAERAFQCAYPSKKRKQIALPHEEEPPVELVSSPTMDNVPSLASLPPQGSQITSDLVSAQHHYTSANSAVIRSLGHPRQRSGSLGEETVGTVNMNHDPVSTSIPDSSSAAERSPSAMWRPETTAINWLPFDFSSIANTTSPVSDMDVYQENIVTGSVNSTTLDITYTPEADGNGTTQIRQDRELELIHSMRKPSQDLSDDFRRSGISSSIAGQSQPGNLYSSGAGSRISQSDRRIGIRQSSLSTATPESTADFDNSESSWTHALSQKVQLVRHDTAASFAMPEIVHLDIMAKICPLHGSSLLSSDYSQHRKLLMDKTTLELLIGLYFDHFHNIYPFLDHSLLCIPVWGWALCLATAAIGARYLYNPDVTAFGDHLCYVLHRKLIEELEFGLVEDSLPYIQARALVAMGLCHSRNRSMANCGHNSMALVYDSCLRLHLLEEDDQIGAFERGQSLEQVWIAWRFRETRRRTMLFIWLMDSTLAITTRLPPRIPFGYVQMWFEARVISHSRDWSVADFTAEEKSRPTIQNTVENLRTNLHGPKGMNEFATTIVVHMLICRIWTASQYLTDSKAERVQSQPHQQTTSRPKADYLGMVPEFSRWRNSTCDQLDVLHWEALSQSAKAGGFEGPVFLQLHLARLLILTPIKELLGYINTRSVHATAAFLPHQVYDRPDNTSAHRQAILTWVSRDRYKARLALIHAGAIFWHVRRYSADTPVQSFAVYLAATVLWAFGKYSKKHLTNKLAETATENVRTVPLITTVPTATSFDDHLMSAQTRSTTTRRRNGPTEHTSQATRPASMLRRMPNLMQLDRPMDDELVQHFIRHGDEMRLYLEGVDDLCSLDGPCQVLSEAALILEEMSNTWTIAGNYIASLTAAVCDGARHKH